jgi:hypothetical protein
MFFSKYYHEQIIVVALWERKKDEGRIKKSIKKSSLALGW